MREYIGIPFAEKGSGRDGSSCYGLLALVLRERAGVSIPLYTESYATTEDAEEIGALVRQEIPASPWHPVVDFDVRPLDAVLIRMRAQPIHVGVVVDPPVFLHVTRGINACIERYDGPRWKKRVLGFYRHADLDRRAA